MGIGRYIHETRHGYRARQSLVGLSVHYTNSYILHICICYTGCRNLHSALSLTKLCLALYPSSLMYVLPYTRASALCPSCSLPTQPCACFTTHPCSKCWRMLFHIPFLHNPVSILHSFTIFKCINFHVYIYIHTHIYIYIYILN